MYGRIFGFHRLARCPKCTSASIRSFTWTIATHCPPAPRTPSGGLCPLLVRATPSISARVPVAWGEERYRSTYRGRRSKDFQASSGSVRDVEGEAPAEWSRLGTSLALPFRADSQGWVRASRKLVGSLDTRRRKASRRETPGCVLSKRSDSQLMLTPLLAGRPRSGYTAALTAAGRAAETEHGPKGSGHARLPVRGPRRRRPRTADLDPPRLRPAVRRRPPVRQAAPLLRRRRRRPHRPPAPRRTDPAGLPRKRRQPPRRDGRPAAAGQRPLAAACRRRRLRRRRPVRRPGRRRAGLRRRRTVASAGRLAG